MERESSGYMHSTCYKRCKVNCDCVLVHTQHYFDSTVDKPLLPLKSLNYPAAMKSTLPVCHRSRTFPTITSNMLRSPSDLPWRVISKWTIMQQTKDLSHRRRTLPNHLHQSRLPSFLERITRCCQSLIVLNQARFPQGEITSCRAPPPTNRRRRHQQPSLLLIASKCYL